MEDSIKRSLVKITNDFKELEKRNEQALEKLDFEESTKLSKAMKKLESIVSNFFLFEKNEKEIKNNKTLLNGEKDKELIEIAKDEIKMLEAQNESLLETIKVQLVPQDPLDEKDVIVEIRQAVGGDEASIFAADLFRMYTKYCEKMGWKITVNEVSLSEVGGYSYISFQIDGDDVYARLKWESGPHRVQRVPRTETQGRVHTSVATVVVMPLATVEDVKINPSDLRIDTYRSGGAGGQHVNTTDSAVRVTHIPTGVVASSQDGRSQHDNKDKALKALYAKILQRQIEETNEKNASHRTLAVKSGDRSDKIRTYNYPQNRVTDHRISLTLNKLDSIVNGGDLDELINALAAFDTHEKMMGVE